MSEINWNALYNKQVQETDRIIKFIRNLPNVSQKVQTSELQQVENEIQEP